MRQAIDAASVAIEARSRELLTALGANFRSGNLLRLRSNRSGPFCQPCLVARLTYIGSAVFKVPVPVELVNALLCGATGALLGSVIHVRLLYSLAKAPDSYRYRGALKLTPILSSIGQNYIDRTLTSSNFVDIP